MVAGDLQPSGRNDLVEVSGVLVNWISEEWLVLHWKIKCPLTFCFCSGANLFQGTFLANCRKSPPLSIKVNLYSCWRVDVTQRFLFSTF